MSRKYPIGIKSFPTIIKEGYEYVDKTALVYQLATYKYTFLSRPRRFGKSLLVSTLESYVKGEKDLFKGLAMEKLETEWKQHPVLHFDLSTKNYTSCEAIHRALNFKLVFYERIYGRDPEAVDEDERLEALIMRAYEQTGMPVVVLIDEYDKPMLDAIDNEGIAKEVLSIMTNFYAPLKACEDYLRFVFLTGITKFSQMNIFSQLNSLKDISMMPKYAAICGITEEEMLTRFSDGIDEMAVALNITRDECFNKLKSQYDGYHFSVNSPDIYNPFSLNQAFDSNIIDNYWFASGTPSFLLHELKRFNFKATNLGKVTAMAGEFDIPIQMQTSPLPLLYQSGYLTIKGYNPSSRLYTLDIPNTEVRYGLMESLLPTVVEPEWQSQAFELVGNMGEAFRKDDFETVMQLLKTYLATVPYTSNLKKDYEGRYQIVLYVLFSMMCNYVQVEVHTPTGRVDMVLESPKNVYAIEMKLNASAQKAADQIDLKDYSSRFALTGKPIVRVGVNFSSRTRNVTSWEVRS